MASSVVSPEDLRVSIQQESYPQCHRIGDAFVPRVSSILKVHPGSLHQRLLREGKENPWLHEFVQQQSIIGNHVHSAIKELLHERPVPDSLTLVEHAMVKKFQRWMHSCRPVILRPPDEAIVSKELGYGGTPDLVCRIGSTTHIVDYNIGRKQYVSKFLQAQGYCPLVEEQGILPQRIAVLLLGGAENASATFIAWDSTAALRREFDTLHAAWRALFPDPHVLAGHHP